MKNMSRRRTLTALGLSAILLSGSVYAQGQFDSVTVFGDSLSDTGNIPRFFGLNIPAPPYYMNMFSNGPVYANYLNSLFGISTPLQDFAIGGAKSGTGNVGGLPGNASIGLPNAGIDGEITYYQQRNPHPGPHDLFVVFGGANDYFNVAQGLPNLGLSGAALTSYLTSPTGPVTATVANLVTDVTRLAGLGVKNFVVPNLPNLGATPLLNGNAATAADGAALVQAHNQALAQAMGALQQKLHVNITIVDLGSTLNAILANPAQFGVDPAHTTQQCIQDPTCVAQHQNYLFWDNVHPTGLVQQELSEVFLSSLDGPTTVGAELDLDRIVQQDLFDHVSARTAALRLGASGFSVSNVGGANGTVGGDGDHPLSAFITDSYGWGSRDNRQNVTGFDYRHNMTSAGADYRLTDRIAVGALFGISETNDSLKNSLGSQSFDSYQFAVYATAFSGGWYGSGAFTFAYDDWGKLNRNVFVGGQTASASTNGHVFGGKLEGGYMLQMGDWTFGPTAEIRMANYTIDGYTERGAIGLNQQVDEQQTGSVIGQVGFQAALATRIGEYSVTPQIRVNFDHDFRHASRAIVTRIASEPATSVTTDLAPDADSYVRLGAGIDVKLTDQLSALVDFDSTVGRDRGEDYSALARLKARF